MNREQQAYEKAQTSYKLARAARQSKGDRIESARESRARQRMEAASAVLRKVQR